MSAPAAGAPLLELVGIEKGFFGGHGIVAAQVPLGTGLAFANRYRGNDNVSVTYFGDGSDEAQMVYNFALPPLVLHAFVTGSAGSLSDWAAGLAPPSETT